MQSAVLTSIILGHKEGKKPSQLIQLIEMERPPTPAAVVQVGKYILGF